MTDVNETDLEKAASALLDALAACSETKLVQGSPRDALIDGTFDLTIVVRGLLASGYELNKRL